MDFNQRIEQALNQMGEDLLTYDQVDFLTYQFKYQYIYDYVKRHELYNSVIALELTRGLLLGDHHQYPLVNDGKSASIYFNHSLSIAKNLIDLHPRIDWKNRDIVYAAAIVHVLINKVNFPNHCKELVEDFGLDPKIYSIITLNLRNPNWSELELRRYYSRIQDDKLALLVKLADRGNNLEQLYEYSVTEAQRYTRETKQFFLPMCVYGKDHYPDLYSVMNILMEKIRGLVDITEIISKHHLERMDELNTEILQLEEENKRFKKYIELLQKED